MRGCPSKASKSFNDILGSDQGTRHAPADLTDDIQALMESLVENEVYQIKKGRTLDDDDGPVNDVITLGLESLCEGTKNPISEYNEAFTRPQTRRKMKPVIPGSLAAATNINSATTHLNVDPTGPAQTPSQVAQESGSTAQSPTSATDADDDEIHDEVSDVVGYLDDLANGVQDSETMLMVSTAADVDLDMV